MMCRPPWQESAKRGSAPPQPNDSRPLLLGDGLAGVGEVESSSGFAIAIAFDFVIPIASGRLRHAARRFRRILLWHGLAKLLVGFRPLSP